MSKKKACIFNKMAFYRLVIRELSAAFLAAIFFTFVDPTFAQENQPFKIGLVLPLTGPASDYGVAIKNGIELAREERPEIFHEISFIYEDSSFDPKLAVSSLMKLVDSDRVNLAVTWGVSFCKALAPVAELRKVPLVGICLDPTVAAQRKYVLRFKNTTDEIMKVQATYLKQQGIRKIGLLLAEHPYLEELKDALKRNLQEGQTLSIFAQVPNNEMDFKTWIIRLIKKSGEFDTIGVFLHAGQISTFYKQARDLELRIPTFGTDFFESLSEVRAAEGSMEGVMFTSIDIKDEFVSRYKARYKNESQLAFGAPAYELAMTVGNLFGSRGNKDSADEVMTLLSKVPEQQGVASGPFRFIDNSVVGKYFQFPVVVKRIVNETFKVVK